MLAEYNWSGFASRVITNTKIFFGAVLKALKADCVCDVGSRDGDQALLFRHLCPEATVLAFEANPLNFARMAKDARLAKACIEMLPFAVSDERGTARFHIADVDYDDPSANVGTSSLLTAENVKIKTSVEVETCRIDEVVLAKCPEARSVGLWIDVEGAEFEVLKGMAAIRERVVAVHVETARIPFRQGQKTLEELVRLMASYGFRLAGSNIPQDGEWGDVVFVGGHAVRSLGLRYHQCRLKGYAARWISADHLAVFLKRRWPAGYSVLRRAYLKVGT